MSSGLKTLTATLNDGSRTGKETMRDLAYDKCCEIIANSPKGSVTRVLSLPSIHWVFENKLMKHMPRKYGDKKTITLHAFENNKKIYNTSAVLIPHNSRATIQHIRSEVLNYQIMKTRYFENKILIHHFNVLHYLMHKEDKMFDFMWLDMMSPIDCIAPYLKYVEEKTNPNGVVILSFINGREKRKIDDKIAYIMLHLDNMELLEVIKYHDTSPMLNVVLKKKLTMQNLEDAVYLGPETQTQTNMTNEDNILENAPVVETTAVAKIVSGKSISIVVEKLDGGYIANPGGKRRIFKQADDIMDTIGVDKILDDMDNEEYQLDIRFIPKKDYVDADALIALLNSPSEESLTLENAKKEGIIEPVAKFNPLPNVIEDDIDAPIKITLANAYTPAQLKAIPWQEYDAQVPLNAGDKAKIAGIKPGSFYTTWNKIINDKMEYQRTPTRIGMTMLAKYYERVLNIRTTTQDKCQLMKDNLTKLIRDIEMLTNGKSHIKSSEVSTKLVAMRKELL